MLSTVLLPHARPHRRTTLPGRGRLAGRVRPSLDVDEESSRSGASGQLRPLPGGISAQPGEVGNQSPSPMRFSSSAPGGILWLIIVQKAVQLVRPHPLHRFLDLAVIAAVIGLPVLWCLPTILLHEHLKLGSPQCTPPVGVQSRTLGSIILRHVRPACFQQAQGAMVCCAPSRQEQHGV